MLSLSSLNLSDFEVHQAGSEIGKTTTMSSSTASISSDDEKYDSHPSAHSSPVLRPSSYSHTSKPIHFTSSPSYTHTGAPSSYRSAAARPNRSSLNTNQIYRRRLSLDPPTHYIPPHSTPAPTTTTSSSNTAPHFLLSHSSPNIGATSRLLPIPRPQGRPSSQRCSEEDDLDDDTTATASWSSEMDLDMELEDGSDFSNFSISSKPDVAVVREADEEEEEESDAKGIRNCRQRWLGSSGGRAKWREQGGATAMVKVAAAATATGAPARRAEAGRGRR